MYGMCSGNAHACAITATTTTPHARAQTTPRHTRASARPACSLDVRRPGHFVGELTGVKFQTPCMCSLSRSALSLVASNCGVCGSVFFSGPRSHASAEAPLIAFGYWRYTDMHAWCAMIVWCCLGFAFVGAMLAYLKMMRAGREPFCEPAQDATLEQIKNAPTHVAEPTTASARHKHTYCHHHHHHCHCHHHCHHHCHCH